MSNPINPRPLQTVLMELDKAGFSKATQRLFVDTFTRIDKVLTNLGQVQSQASITGRTEQIGTTVSGLAATGDINAATKIVGRTEGIGTTASKLDSSGNLLSTDNIAADGTGSPLTGGKRGFVALDSNNRLAGAFRNNAVNANAVPTASTTLTNGGGTTVVTVNANSQQYGDGQVSYNSGSYDPGAFGSSFSFCDDPTFAGGAVTYQFSSTPVNTAAANGRVNVGQAFTTNGVPSTGGGYNGGNGGAGGRGFPKG